MRFSRAVALAMGSMVLAACDIPTEAPILEHRWILPVENTTVSVAEMLPSGVTVSGTRFAVSISPQTTTTSLGTVCPPCVPFNGQAGVVPLFNTTIITTTTMPANVTSAVIASGSVQVVVQNGFSFDPTAGGGSVTVTLTSGGTTLGTTTINSASGGLPAFQSRTLSIPIVGTVGSSLTATTVIDSKGGQTTTINTSQQLTVRATPQAILISSARVNVAGKTVAFADVDVPNLSDGIVDVLEEGALILDITNPFGVGISVRLDIKVPGGPTVTRTVAITSAATSTVRIAYTGAELKSFLSRENVTMSGTGTVSSSAGAITVTPAQKVEIKAKLDVTFLIGS